MSPVVTFLFGLAILALFICYFSADAGRPKRRMGLALSVLLTSFCLVSVWPPFDVHDATGKVVRAGKIPLGLDLKGGTAFLIRLVREGAGSEISASAQEQAVEVIRSRVDKFGVGEPVISPVGKDQILVQIPGLDAARIAAARDQLQRVAKLEFRLVHPQSASLIAQRRAGQTPVIPPGYRVEVEERTERADGAGAAPANRLSRTNSLMNNPDANALQEKKITEEIVVRSRADMTGERVKSAYPFFNERGWGVSLNFDGGGGRQFAELTRAHVGEQLAVMLDNKVVSAPNLNEAITGGSAQITGGSMGEAECRNLASVLENPLQTPVRILEERSVSATLGKDAIRSGVLSGVAGLILTLGFALVYYRFAGLVASIALVANMILHFGMMSLFGFVLTLPGIAGIILTIGMAIDANVLIYERLREELAAGKNLRTALDVAYPKAFSAIIDGNVTTLVTTIILFYFATGPVKGFAVALMLGVIASMFSALIVTRVLFNYAIVHGWVTNVRMLNLIPDRRFDFLGKARVALTGSLAVILLCVGVFAARGQKNFGIDFRGGDLLVLAVAPGRTLTAADVRGALPAELKDSTVQVEGQGGRQFVSVRSVAGAAPRIDAGLKAALPAAGLTTEQSESVGALVGARLARNSLWALALGALGIMLYVTLRFEFAFSVGALVALVHTLVVTVGLFALLGRELSLIMVGAVLAIAGYSMNDTIVVFDRIRSGFHEGRRGSVREIMNACINETLGRTLLTAGLTFITVLALFLGGGPVLQDFALAMLIGVIVGTYSSIFVASPIVLWLSRSRGGQGHDLRAQVSRPKSAVAAVPVLPARA